MSGARNVSGERGKEKRGGGGCKEWVFPHNSQHRLQFGEVAEPQRKGRCWETVLEKKERKPILRGSALRVKVHRLL